MKPPLKSSEEHRFIHRLTGIDPFNDQMTESVRNVDQAPPGASPLETSAQVEGLLSLLQHSEKDKHGSIREKKSSDKEGGKNFAKDTEDGGIGSRGQEEDHPGGPGKDFQENEKNESELKPGDQNEERGKNERVECQRKYSPGNPRRKEEGNQEQVKNKKSRKTSPRNNPE
jgi:hypothetical protein